MKLDKSFIFKKFKQELETKYGPQKAKVIWQYAEHVLRQLEAAEPDADKSSRSFVFPAVAIYRAVEHYAPDEALAVTRAYGTKTGIRMRNIFRKVTALPGIPTLMWKNMDKIAAKMSSGYECRDVVVTEHLCSLDVTGCPLYDKAKALGTPEAVQMICCMDKQYMTGFRGVKYTRTKSVAEGDDCCDYRLRDNRKKKKQEDLTMKANYKNWMPKGMVASFAGGAVGAWITALGVRTLMPEGTAKKVMTIASTATGGLLTGVSVWSYMMYRAFDYNGKRQMSRYIIEGIADGVDLPEGGCCLDVGCGSGALAIAIAKRNPKAQVIGIDRWGKEYASFNKPLCESNARAEGVTNVSFQQGDALRLDFPDETFDAVASNYVYHNIPSKDRQAILLETLRTLKKGGTFAIHDIFSAGKYGDMSSFVKKLKEMGYEKVELIDTTNGKWIRKSEAGWMGLSGSALLTGKK